MRVTALALAGIALTSTLAVAQVGNGGGGVGGSVGGSTAGIAAGVSGSGVSPGPKPENGKGQGTTGNSIGLPKTDPSAGAMNNGGTFNNAPGSSAVDVPTGQPSSH